MEVVGRKPDLAGLTLHVVMTIHMVAVVHQDSRVMERKHVKMLMSARRKRLANVHNANARILGEVTSAVAVAVYCTCENMMHV